MNVKRCISVTINIVKDILVFMSYTTMYFTLEVLHPLVALYAFPHASH